MPRATLDLRTTVVVTPTRDMRPTTLRVSCTIQSGERRTRYLLLKQVLWAAEQKLSAGDIRQLNDMHQCKTQTGGTGGLTKPTPASTPACSWKTPTTNDMLQCVDGSTCSGGLAVGPAVRSAQPMHQLCAIRKLVVVGWLKVCLAIGIVALAIAPTMVVSALAEHVFVYMPIIRNI